MSDTENIIKEDYTEEFEGGVAESTEDEYNEEEEEEEEEDEYETVDITENEHYQVGSAFFENQDGEGIAEILTNLVKVHISMVDSNQDMIRKQSEQISATHTLSKLLQKYCKKLDEKI